MHPWAMQTFHADPCTAEPAPVCARKKRLSRCLRKLLDVPQIDGAAIRESANANLHVPVRHRGIILPVLMGGNRHRLPSAQGPMMPLRSAIVTACVRARASSLDRMLFI